jgi:hypothetical protein
MKEIRAEIDIQASPEKVWQILTDLDKYPEWNPFLHHAIGKVELGAKVDVIFKSGAKNMTLHCIVTKVEPNRELRWKYHVGFPFLFQGEHCFIIEPAGENLLHFVDKEIFTGLLIPMMVHENDRSGFEAEDQALKSRAEQFGKGG